MGKDTLRYMAVCAGIYLGLALFEVLVLHSLIDFFPASVWTPVIFYGILLIVIDPILTRIISNRFGFKEPKRDGDDLL